jgi:hypothetical protein
MIKIRSHRTCVLVHFDPRDNSQSVEQIAITARIEEPPRYTLPAPFLTSPVKSRQDVGLPTDCHSELSSV